MTKMTFNKKVLNDKMTTSPQRLTSNALIGSMLKGAIPVLRILKRRPFDVLQLHIMFALMGLIFIGILSFLVLPRPFSVAIAFK